MDIKLLTSNEFFKTWELKTWDILFDEWDFDNFLYIIEKWKLVIEKFTTKEKTEVKELAILKHGDIFWEGALSNNNPKEVRIKAVENTTLLRIDAKNDFEEFLKKYPKDWIILLSQIIDISNKRLLESNFLITSSHTITKYISEIWEFNNKNLFDIIDKLLTIYSSKFIIYIEKSPVFDNIFILRYNTKNPWKMQEKILQIDDMLNIQEIWLKAKDKVLVEKLKIGNKVIWYLIIWWEKSFSAGEKKSIAMVSVSIAGFVKQKQNREENEREENEE